MHREDNIIFPWFLFDCQLKGMVTLYPTLMLSVRCRFSYFFPQHQYQVFCQYLEYMLKNATCFRWLCGMKTKTRGFVNRPGKFRIKNIFAKDISVAPLLTYGSLILMMFKVFCLSVLLQLCPWILYNGTSFEFSLNVLNSLNSVTKLYLKGTSWTCNLLCKTRLLPQRQQDIDKRQDL